MGEIFEFLVDLALGFNIQKSGLVDTMTDLIVDFIGACLVVIGVYRYLTKKKDGFIKRIVNQIIYYLSLIALI